MCPTWTGVVEDEASSICRTPRLMRVVAATVTVSCPNSRMNRVGITAVAESTSSSPTSLTSFEVLGVELRSPESGRWC